MFKPLTMQHIELSLLEHDAAQAALLLANFGALRLKRGPGRSTAGTARRSLSSGVYGDPRAS